MKSKFYIVLSYIFLVQFFVGQEITQSEIILFKIKSITIMDGDGMKYTEFYNNNGDLTKQKSLNANNEFQIDRELFYNDFSQLIKEYKYNSNGEIHSTLKYYYNEKDQLSKEEYIESSGKVYATRTFEYDKKGNKISEIQTSDIVGNSVTKYRYNSKNLPLIEDKSGNEVGKEERVNYKYNREGQLIEKQKRYFYSKTTIIWTYSYNKAGKLIKLFEKSSSGATSTTLYEYDSNGLLTSYTWESSISKKPQKTIYQINFK